MLLKNILKFVLLRILPVILLIAIMQIAISFDKPIADTTKDMDRDTESMNSNNQENIAGNGQKDNIDNIDEFFLTLDSTKKLLSEGYEVSDTAYTDDHKLSLLSRFLTDSPLLFKNEAGNPIVDIYMDFILVYSGDYCDVYNKNGRLIYEGLNTFEYIPVYSRDRNNNPVFSRTDKETNLIKYYFLDDAGILVESNYNDAADNRGLYINYPSYYGASQNDIRVKYSPDSGLYGFENADGSVVVNPVYKNAYNFSEGLCAIVDGEGVLNYTDRDIYRTIFNNGWFYNENNERVCSLLTEPETRGIESLGFFYFENGLCRVRCQTVNAYLWEANRTKEIFSDRDMLINTEGVEFQVPAGYDIVSYSNGMILLEKGGLYGYMSHSGEWVINPIYTNATPFCEGLAAVGFKGKIGLVNTDGKFVVPMMFDYIGMPSGGIITLYDDENGWAVMSKCVQSGG